MTSTRSLFDQGDSFQLLLHLIKQHMLLLYSAMTSLLHHSTQVCRVIVAVGTWRPA